MVLLRLFSGTANYRESLSVVQSTRSAEITISQRVSTATGLRCYVLLIAQHEDRIHSEALSQDAEAQYQVNRFIRKMAEARIQRAMKCFR
jgi:hypothetical protein